MRDIKFRGKHIHAFIEPQNTGIWVYGYLCNDHYINSEELMGEMLVDKDTVGQYIGLYDKNGTEIYEGDIVHIPDNWEEYGWASGENYAIDFKEGRFRLKPKYKSNAIGYDLEHTDELEVIGNIYDNPELLGE